MKGSKRELGRYSLGIGDRFGLEARAQLRALKMALARGVEITPVWNKSNREHSIIGTGPMSVRLAADLAVKEEGWNHSYFVDADHIGMKTVDRFMDASDFFTIDVAEFIGKCAAEAEIEEFVEALSPQVEKLRHTHFDEKLNISSWEIREFARKYLPALQEASKIYQYIKRAKGEEPFITEVSVDEACERQIPAELYLFVAGLVHLGVKLQTVAPKFSGKFLKGTDYVGDTVSFANEFKEDLSVISIARELFQLPDLKLSVHSGSDKFSLYPIMYEQMMKSGTGIHLKTAGTTWLEEVIGLASGNHTLHLAKKIYGQAYNRYEELCQPYKTVVEIERHRLPEPRAVVKWSEEEFVSALRHDLSDPHYNKDFRQLVHIAFRIAAEMGDEFRNGLLQAREAIERNVTENLYFRHIEPLFVGKRK